jgi:indole-3-glycerol phosphate synthase/phosphoribosylanthranilate isomerase
VRTGDRIVNIIEEITKKRRARIAALGHDGGIRLPARRTAPSAAFGRRTGKRDFFVIGEIKRASPSRGLFSPGADAAAQARFYVERGIRTVSVLTEEEHFSGSLEDLCSIKRSFPELCVLRKDFIIDEEDLAVTHRAGGDAVLLIASMHSLDSLRRLYRFSKRMGLEVLLEVHDAGDMKKARAVKPEITGFNSRDLATFRIDPAVPLSLRPEVDWQTRTVFESGITSIEHAAVALSGGFSGMLIGEGAMKNPALLSDIMSLEPENLGDFWRRIFSVKPANRPLVKVCGITNERDARFAVEAGANLLGFIFAPSPRRARASLLERLTDLPVPRVCVVVQEEKDRELVREVQDLLTGGLVDAVQFHGQEDPDACYDMAFPYYKAIRVSTEEDADLISRYKCPRTLIDAFVPGKAGGTGRRIADHLVESSGARQRLWLAGGIGPENVSEIISKHNPELIDASSGLESEPGIKDHDRLQRFFREIEAVCEKERG